MDEQKREGPPLYLEILTPLAIIGAAVLMHGEPSLLERFVGWLIG